VPIAAAAIFAGLWWFSPGAVNRAGPAAEPSILETDAATPSPELEALLSRAGAAFEEARLVMPAGESARDLYRQVLTVDASNERALDGLRAISDTYLEQATVAASRGEIAAATEALAVATEISPDNPCIAIVNALVLAQADRLLARAELAVADGNTDRALDLLAEAELYGSVDADVIAAARSRIVQNVAEQRFLGALAVADEHLSAGRLLTPAGNNAHQLLLDLKEEWGENARLNASMERLGERLLTRAAFATAAGSFDEASRALRATGALGVLEQDVVAGQRSLQRARAAAATAQSAMAAAAAATNVSDAPDATSSVAAVPATPEPVQEPVAIIDAPTVDPADSATASPGSADGTSAAGLVATTNAAVASGAGRRSIEQQRQLPTITLADLAIEKYVAPAFPRSARRRDLEGFVELRFSVNPDGSTGDIETVNAEPGSVFVASAKKAVSQWRFAPRDDVFTTQVKLSFALEP
jgi:protein TonB